MRTACVTVDGLDAIDQQLRQLQERHRQLEAKAARSPPGSVMPATRSELAQLHGEAESLVAQQVDAVSTANLRSGRLEAQAKRKELVEGATQLIETTEARVSGRFPPSLALVSHILSCAT